MLSAGGDVSGGGAAPDPLNATICMTQGPGPISGAVALYVPVVVTARSMAMSPSGLVSRRCVKPPAGPVVPVATSFPATSRSLALVVVTEPELLVLLFPLPPT